MIISPYQVIVKSPFQVIRVFVDSAQGGVYMTPIYAQRIREVRQRAGLTQSEFAFSIGTTKNQLSKYELGNQDTPTKVIISVCEKYNVDANWLLGLNAEAKVLNVYDLIGEKPILTVAAIAEKQKRG